MSTFLSP